MKKLYVVLIGFLVFTLLACQDTKETRSTLYDAFTHLEQVEETSIDDFYYDVEMLGDAYYLTGVEDVYIHYVLFYKGEYISFYMTFQEPSNDNQLIIDFIQIEYIDYEEDIDFMTMASDTNNPFIKDGLNYETFFNNIESLSLNDVDWILETLNLM